MKKLTIEELRTLFTAPRIDHPGRKAFPRIEPPSVALKKYPLPYVRKADR